MWYWRATKTGRGLCTHPEFEGLIKGGGGPPMNRLPDGSLASCSLVPKLPQPGFPSMKGQ